ncbi:MAG TPA: ABC transporter permease, partial [Agromyces sp.]
MSDEASTNTTSTPRDTTTVPAQAPEPSRWHTMWQQIVTGNALISVLSVVLALIVGAIMIAFTDEEVQQASVYFFARPGDTFIAVWNSVSGAYSALFQGSIYNFRRDSFVDGIKPLTDTLTFAT